ncbi:MAG: hypothetical protein NVS9B15_03340 [Acidobacteriaceae bacterium]
MNKISRTAMLLAFAASTMLAQSGFDGTWKMNKEKSKLTGDTFTISDAGGGSMKFSDSNGSYTFKTDGTEATNPFGSKETWKQDSPNTYETTTSMKGTETGHTKWTVSEDGKTLKTDSNGTRPNGEKWNTSATFARVGGSGKGLAGTWKSTQVNLDPVTMSMKMEGDTLHWDIPAEKATWEGKVDGKDLAPSGPQIPDGLMLAVTKTGPNTIKMVEKMKDKPVYMGTYSVSADGKIMTVRGTNGQGREPVTEIWEKQ